jgi:hypothetical protein
MNLGLWRLPRPTMALHVAPQASGRYVPARIRPFVLTCAQVFRSALEMLADALANSVSFRERVDVLLPKRLRAIEAATFLVTKCLMAEFLKLTGHEAST